MPRGRPEPHPNNLRNLKAPKWLKAQHLRQEQHGQPKDPLAHQGPPDPAHQQEPKQEAVSPENAEALTGNAGTPNAGQEGLSLKRPPPAEGQASAEEPPLHSEPFLSQNGSGPANAGCG